MARGLIRILEAKKQSHNATPIHKKSGNQALNSLAICIGVLVILTRQQKESMVIRLAEEGKSTRFIAEAAHVSLKDIGTIIRRHTGEEEEPACQDKCLSTSSRAFKLFKEGKSKVDVAIALDIDADQVLRRYEDYLRLLSLDHLTTMYKELGNDGLYFLNYLYNQLKWEGLATKKDIHRIIGAAGELRNLDQTLLNTASDIGRLNFFKSNLEKDVDDLTRRIDDYDAILLERSQQARQF
jgi:hypothetical protein